MIGVNVGRYEGVITSMRYLPENKRGQPMLFFQAAQKFEINPVSGKFHPRKSKIFPQFFAVDELAEEIYNDLEKGDFVRLDFSLSSYSSKRNGGTITTCRVYGCQKLQHPSEKKDTEKMEPEEWIDLTKAPPPGPWKGEKVFTLEEGS